MQDIILIGCGGHAKSVVDAIESMSQYRIRGFVDRELHDFEYRGYKVIATDEELLSLFEKGVRNAHIAIGYMGKKDIRPVIFESLKRIGYELPVIADSTAIIAKDAELGEGCFISKKTVVNAGAIIGKNVILNTGSIIEHECKVGDYTHVAVNATLCGNVMVGTGSFIGAGATVIQGIEIGNNVLVGAGSLLRENVGNQKKVYVKNTVVKVENEW